MLTARDGHKDRVAALDPGADDYIVKPVDLQNSWPFALSSAAPRPTHTLMANWVRS